MHGYAQRPTVKNQNIWIVVADLDERDTKRADNKIGARNMRIRNFAIKFFDNVKK